MKRLISCACGCNLKFEELDKWGRKRKYISGHNGRKYSDPNQYKREWAKRNKDRIKLTRNTTGKAKKIVKKQIRKIKVMEEFNSRCSMCSLEYDGGNGSSFIFHHVDPKTRKHGIGSLLDCSEAALQKELKKCVLLCANCHLITHYGKF